MRSSILALLAATSTLVTAPSATAQTSLGPGECQAAQPGVPGADTRFARWTDVDYTGPGVRAHCGQYYNLFVPEGPQPEAGWPLLVFLDLGSYRGSLRRQWLDPEDTSGSRAALAYIALTDPVMPMAVLYASATVSRGGSSGNEVYDPTYDPYSFSDPEFGEDYNGNGVFIPPGLVPADYNGTGVPYTDRQRPMPEKDAVMLVQHVKHHADALPPDVADPIQIDLEKVVYFGNSAAATTLSWVVLGPDRALETFPQADPGTQETLDTRVKYAILDNGSVLFRRFEQDVEIEGLPAGIHLPVTPVQPDEQFYDRPSRHLANVPSMDYQDDASALYYGWDGDAGPVTQLNRGIQVYMSARFPTSEALPVTWDVDPVTGPGPAMFAEDVDQFLHPSWHQHVWKLLYPENTTLVTTFGAAYTFAGLHPFTLDAPNAIPDKVVPNNSTLQDLAHDEMAWIIEQLSEPMGTWTDLGHALAGVSGEPTLLGEGALTPGTPASVTLSNAAPSSLSVLIAGLTRVDVPFLHGVLVPDTDILVWLQTDATGGAVVAADWPDVLAGGLDVYFQQWTLDPAASFGASASNALQATTP